jgi:hypothetical protein
MSLLSSTLIPHIQSHFTLNRSRAKCLALMILSLLESRTVNLTRMSIMVTGLTKTQSTYKRMRRFLREISFDPSDIARFIFIILNIPNDITLNIILDRTNWKFGRVHINILYLAISYKGVGFPVFWSWLEDKKQGNSDHFDRIDILETFIKTFGKERINALYADREFIGDVWIKWLQNQGISYVIRLKENGQFLGNAKGRIKLASDLFRALPNNKSISIGVRDIGKRRLYSSAISALRNAKGELVVLMHSDDLVEPCALYKERWQIELLFRMMKTGGFNLESTHVTEPERMDVLLVIVAIATTLSANAGLIHEAFKPIAIKKHGFKEMNTVRRGLEDIIRIIKNKKKFVYKNEVLMEILKFIQYIFEHESAKFYAKNRGVLKIVP